jgi:hypothetical protein
MSGSIVGGVVLALSIALAVPGSAQTPGAPADVRAQPPSPAPPDDPWAGRWSVREVTRDGQRVLVRRNATAASLAGDPRFPERIRVAVPLPRGADYTPADDLHNVETLLVEALERNRTTIGVLVLTTDTVREFVFYTADAPSATRVIADLLPKAAPYELKAEAATDRRWELYAAFRP